MVLTLYSDVNCDGKSVVIKDREVNLAKVGVSFQVKVKISVYIIKDNKSIFQSAKVEGNPWILFSEERYQEYLCYLEEGR